MVVAGDGAALAGPPGAVAAVGVDRGRVDDSTATATVPAATCPTAPVPGDPVPDGAAPDDAGPGAVSTATASGAIQTFVLEVALTFLLMWVILSVSTGASEKGITAGIAVGSVIALEAMFAGPISSASMNPARSLGPALVSLHFESLWIYLSATVLGAVLAVPLCRVIRGADCCGPQAKAI